MLATFIIGLREGLEAALIVGIIAAFLRNNSKSLFAMWVGVVLALVLSVIVGIALEMTECALPQASQEGMESVIGAVAVFFVTGMIMWMNTHAHNMKKELETDAAEAISQSSAWALASMAFLAVLKEGFETSVFLLATFSVAQSAMWAAVGAVIGLIVAVIIGCGIYFGGIRINLSRFFRFTGLFLILVAGGLIITSLQTAHEAGWLNIGQQRIADLSWLVPPGTIRSALITGVLGIPPDPNQIQTVAWLLYIGIVSVMVYWPAHRRPAPVKAARLSLAFAGVMALAALALFLFYPPFTLQLPGNAPLVSSAEQTPAGQVQLLVTAGNGYRLSVQSAAGKITQITLPADAAIPGERAGLPTREWNIKKSVTPAQAPDVVTLDQVVALYGNRIPIGLNPAMHPGPYQAQWTVHCSVQASAAGDALLDASGHAEEVITLSGSGLQSSRTVTVRTPTDEVSACNWQVSSAWQQRVSDALQQHEIYQDNYRFWAYMLPALLAALALIFAVSALRVLLKFRNERSSVIREYDLSFGSQSHTHLPKNKG
ncbi:iron uptake transporter permease EfeU [Rahnella woolbedingensis]|uniref:Iron permease n=1 Tax=Rahnella woolbedingensis TaxID=1510574 RepID=A0A419N2J6_9GAMM|nr:iron uptake transporter permease EfeU [Rahnella woolbedingensis]RJT34992.1 iron permease [Rahnella woolbedingensis]